MKLSRIGIMHIRGGLGNQLYQLSALSFYSKRLHFQPFIYDYDLYLSERDENTPQYRYLSFENLFSVSQTPIILTNFWAFVTRQLYRLPIRNSILNGKQLDNLVSEGRKPPYVFIIRDSFEEDRFPFEVDNLDIVKSLSVRTPSPIFRNSDVAIHLRISGYSQMSRADKETLYKVSEHVAMLGHKAVDIYTDTIPSLLGKIELKEGLMANWPEIHYRLSSPELLNSLSNYRILISNGSSISRWANYLACCKQEQTFINIKKDFPKNLLH